MRCTIADRRPARFLLATVTAIVTKAALAGYHKYFTIALGVGRIPYYGGRRITYASAVLSGTARLHQVNASCCRYSLRTNKGVPFALCVPLRQRRSQGCHRTDGTRHSFVQRADGSATFTTLQTGYAQAYSRIGSLTTEYRATWPWRNRGKRAALPFPCCASHDFGPATCH